MFPITQTSEKVRYAYLLGAISAPIRLPASLVVALQRLLTIFAPETVNAESQGVFEERNIEKLVIVLARLIDALVRGEDYGTLELRPRLGTAGQLRPIGALLHALEQGGGALPELQRVAVVGGRGLRLHTAARSSTELCAIEAEALGYRRSIHSLDWFAKAKNHRVELRALVPLLIDLQGRVSRKLIRMARLFGKGRSGCRHHVGDLLAGVDLGPSGEQPLGDLGRGGNISKLEGPFE